MLFISDVYTEKKKKHFVFLLLIYFSYMDDSQELNFRKLLWYKKENSIIDVYINKDIIFIHKIPINHDNKNLENKYIEYIRIPRDNSYFYFYYPIRLTYDIILNESKDQLLIFNYDLKYLNLLTLSLIDKQITKKCNILNKKIDGLFHVISSYKLQNELLLWSQHNENLKLIIYNLKKKNYKICKNEYTTGPFYYFVKTDINKISKVYYGCFNDKIIENIFYCKTLEKLIMFISSKHEKNKTGHYNTINEIWFGSNINDMTFKWKNYEIKFPVNLGICKHIFGSFIIGLYYNYNRYNVTHSVDIYCLDVLFYQKWTKVQTINGINKLRNINVVIHDVYIELFIETNKEKTRHLVIKIGKIVPKIIKNKYKLIYVNLINGYFKKIFNIKKKYVNFLPLVLNYTIMKYYCNFM